MELKVGDKVKVIKADDWPDSLGRIHDVTAIMPPSSSFVCRISGHRLNNMLMFDWEIEKVPSYAPGEQLLFSFVEKE